MDRETDAVDPFAVISEEWHIGRGKAPVTWFSNRFPLKKQKADEGCSRVMGKVVYLLNRCRHIEEEQIDNYMYVGEQGIDPKLLTRGIQRMGVDCEEYFGATTQDLLHQLSDGSTVAILDIQAPWASRQSVAVEASGHYVMAYFADSEYIYFYDSGNDARFGKIKINNLQTIWHDRMIRSSRRIIKGWMLVVKVCEQIPGQDPI